MTVQCGPTQDQTSYSTGKFTLKASMSASISRTVSQVQVDRGENKRLRNQNTANLSELYAVIYALTR